MGSSDLSKSIKIFLASPSDVEEERETLASIVSEINEVLAFLVPDQKTRLELMRYETNTYPDYGQAQEVINKQIPQDYDIFIGVMWKRCGTPTASAPSGTIEEFNRAVARRKTTGRPKIMFYFCEEPFAPLRGEEYEQYGKLLQFRDELQLKGYTSSYPSRKVFRQYVRGRLLRALADILATNKHHPIAPETPVKLDQEIEKLAEQYDKIRVQMSGGPERTRIMSQIQGEMRLRASVAKNGLKLMKASASAGLRLAAISILEVFPDAKEASWLADRLNLELEKPFVGYAAAVALAQLIRSLDFKAEDVGTTAATVRENLFKAIQLADPNSANDTSRIDVLRTALDELTLLYG